MRTRLQRDLTPVGASAESAETIQTAPDCGYDARAIASVSNGLDSLRSRIYACYGWAQQHVIVDGDSMDRLSVLSALATTDDSARRRRLFLALEPVWRSMNANGGPDSPYRMLLTLEQRARTGRESALAERARALGLHADTLESWLVSLLQTWRTATADS